MSSEKNHRGAEFADLLHEDRTKRQSLRDIAEGKAFGDTTLADPAAVARLKANYEEELGYAGRPVWR
jgi:hypothetical protein